MVLQQSGLPFARRWQAGLRAWNWNGLLYVNVRDVMTVWARPKQASGAGAECLHSKELAGWGSLRSLVIVAGLRSGCRVGCIYFVWQSGAGCFGEPGLAGLARRAEAPLGFVARVPAEAECAGGGLYQPDFYAAARASSFPGLARVGSAGRAGF